MAILGCSDEQSQAEQDPPKKEKETRSENLKKFMGEFQRYVLAGDNELSIDYGRSLFPTQETFEMACTFEKDSEGYQLISEWIRTTKPRNAKNYLKIYPFRAWQTEIIVTSMTGAELASSTDKSVGFHEEAGALARAGLLRSDQEFFSVDFRKSGDQVGQRYELFVWDSERKRWKMLGPIWRALSHSKKN